MKIESGVILEIELPMGFGYAYAKYVDIHLLIGRYFDSSLLKVYDFISKEPIKNIDLFKDKDLLFGPALLTGKPSVRKTGWKAVGKYLTDDDFKVPFFKSVNKFPYIVENESLIGPWHLVTLGVSEVITPYEKIKHLEQAVLEGSDQIEARIVMELLRRDGREINKFYELNKVEPHIKRVYLRMINVPIYSTIPKEIRGKPIV